MTNIDNLQPKILPNNVFGRKTAIIAYDNLFLFEYSIAVDLFAYPRPSLGVDWYDCEVFCVDGANPRAIGGVSINGRQDLAGLCEFSTIIIPGWSKHDCAPPPELIAQLKAAHKRGARLLSICSGAYLLAYCGLLDEKSATTHWLYMADFKARFPKIKVQEDVLYIDEGNIITSAGSSAGIDAGIHLIRRDFGAKIANMVARRMVMPAHREGGQAQYVEAPVAKRAGKTIGDAMDWALLNLEKQIRIKDLAKIANMSERTFLRHFFAANAQSPKEWLNGERINHARVLLETTNHGLDQISFDCGFATPETFRSAFKRRLGISPGAYRTKFSFGLNQSFTDKAMRGIAN